LSGKSISCEIAFLINPGIIKQIALYPYILRKGNATVQVLFQPSSNVRTIAPPVLA
jgi:hypothetical protein